MASGVHFLDARSERRAGWRTVPIFPLYSLTFFYFALQRLSDKYYPVTQGLSGPKKSKVYLNVYLAKPKVAVRRGQSRHVENQPAGKSAAWGASGKGKKATPDFLRPSDQMGPLHQFFRRHLAGLAMQQRAGRAEHHGKRQAARAVAKRLAELGSAQAGHAHREIQRTGL